MFLLILGILIFLLGAIASRIDPTWQKLRNIFRIAGVLIMLLGLFTSTVRQIDSGAVGVLLMFKQVQKDRVLYEGLNFVNPIYDVEEMSVRQLSYTMSGVKDEGQKIGDDAVRVRCSDGLEVAIDLTILYRLVPSKAPDVYQAYRLDYEDRIVRPVIRSIVREIAVYFTAADLYSSKRQQFESMLTNKMFGDFQAKGLLLDQVLIRNVQLPQSITESIERKIAAMQDAQRQDYILEKVRKEADMKRVEAQGIADAQRIISEGLTDKLIQFEAIKIQKELVNSPNAKIILLGSGKSTPVILNADGK